MTKEYWQNVMDRAFGRLEELRDRRDALDAEREEVNAEIVQLEQLVLSLHPIASGREMPLVRTTINATGLTLTDACREVLKQSENYFTPILIRNILEESGYDLTQHSNPLASIHGVLKRMVESGEAEAITHDVRGTMYRGKSAGIRVPGSSSTVISSPMGSADGGAKGAPLGESAREMHIKRGRLLEHFAEIMNDLDEDGIDATLKAAADEKVKRSQKKNKK